MQYRSENTTCILFSEGHLLTYCLVVCLLPAKISIFTNTNMLINMTSSLFSRIRDCVYWGGRGLGGMELMINIYPFLWKFTNSRDGYMAIITNLDAYS